MSVYSEDDANYAKGIVESLIGAEPQAVELESGLVVSDLETDAEEFSAELDFLGRIGADVPAIHLAGEELIPVALSFFTDPGWLGVPTRRFMGRKWWRSSPMFEDWAYDYFLSLIEEVGRFRDFDTMPRDQARSTFLRRATDFLATRVAAIRDFGGPESSRWSEVSFLSLPQRARGPRVQSPGCHFTVSTNSNGLRVFWSGAYRISPNYFNHPTTPTAGVLQSGTYVFGVDGGAYGNHIQWDLNAIVTLPGIPHAHLNY